MKKLANLAVAPLKRTPVNHAETFAWWLFLAMAGYGVGWASGVAYEASKCWLAV